MNLNTYIYLIDPDSDITLASLSSLAVQTKKLCTTVTTGELDLRQLQ